MSILNSQIKQKDLAVMNYAKDVLTLIAKELEIDIIKLQTKDRDRPLSEARQIYSYIIRNVSTVEISYQKAGKLINRDHATIMNQARVAQDISKSNKKYAEKLNKCVLAFQENFEVKEFNNIPQY
jgi:chromosomal replication initiation ATPase DnaA